MVSKDGRKWCCDLLDWLYKKDQILQEGEVILKRYTPTTSYQSCIIINVYIVEHDDSKVRGRNYCIGVMGYTELSFLI